MQSAISIQNLTKRFGNNRGVESVELEVQPGEIVGFLGPNGAGKTTTINMLLGFTTPTAGSARVFGHDVTHDGIAARKRIGYLSNDMALDDSLTGKQELAYLGKLFGAYDDAYVQSLIDRLDVETDKKIRNLSRGNKQKIGLVSALMHQPDVLVLDEPTSGLDPLIQATFNTIILEHKAAGRAAFISSHVLSEVQELCDRFVFIREGRIIADKTLEELRAQTARQINLSSPDAKKIAAALQKLKGTDHLRQTSSQIHCAYLGDINEFLQIVSKHNIHSLTIAETDLEEVFMNYYDTPEKEAA